MSESKPMLMPPAGRLEVFFDGDCPLCVKEMRFLQRRDTKKNIRFTDIADSEFSPSSYGLEMDDFMSAIRGRLPSGEMVVGIEVFRQLYAAVGFKRLVKLSRAPGIRHLLTWGYKWFAANRLRLTGRCKGKGCTISHLGHEEATAK